MQGYYSTTAKIKDRKSPAEQALAAVDSFECLELLEKVPGHWGSPGMHGRNHWRRFACS